jgi:hypothetical protein
MSEDFESWCRMVRSILHDDGYEREVDNMALGNLYDEILSPWQAAERIKSAGTDENETWRYFN